LVSSFSGLKTPLEYYREKGRNVANVFDLYKNLYNRKRRHESLGYLSPEDYLKTLKKRQRGSRRNLKKPTVYWYSKRVSPHTK